MAKPMRRKIYEQYNRLERNILKLDDLLISKKVYEEKKDKIRPNNIFEEIKENYKTLKTLMFYFFNKKNFKLEKHFKNDFYILKFEDKKLNSFFLKNKNLKLNEKILLSKLNSFFNKSQNINSYKKAKKMLKLSDKLNDLMGRVIKIPYEKIK